MSTVACTTSPVRVAAKLERATPGRGVDHQLVTPGEAGSGRAPGQAPDAVAAHLGDAAVGVEQRHRRVGTVAPGPDDDQAVGADPPVAIAEHPNLGRHDPDGVVFEGAQHQEVVAGGVQLAEAEVDAHQLHNARTAGRVRSGFSAARTRRSGGRAGTTCVGGGRRPGSAGRRLVGLVEGHLAVEVGQQLPVADGLLGGPGQAPTRPVAPHLVEEAGPAMAHRLDPCSMRSPARPGEPAPDHPNREDRGSKTVETRPERRERPPGQLDHLERPDDPPGVAGLDAGRRLRVELL